MQARLVLDDELARHLRIPGHSCQEQRAQAAFLFTLLVDRRIEPGTMGNLLALANEQKRWRGWGVTGRRSLETHRYMCRNSSTLDGTYVLKSSGTGRSRIRCGIIEAQRRYSFSEPPSRPTNSSFDLSSLHTTGPILLLSQGMHRVVPSGLRNLWPREQLGMQWSVTK